MRGKAAKAKPARCSAGRKERRTVLSQAVVIFPFGPFVQTYSRVLVLRTSGKVPDSGIPMISYRKSQSVFKNLMFL